MSETFYFLGYDPAPAQRVENDDGALVVLRAEDMRSDAQKEDRAPSVTDFQADFVYGRIIRDMSPRHCSGLVYGLHEKFGFANIVLDGQGGGLGILKEMESAYQIVGGVEREFSPIVTRDNTGFVHAQFVLSLFRRSDPAIVKLWGDKFQGDDQLLAAMHGDFSEAVNNHWFGLPPFWEDMSRERQAEVGFNSEKYFALRTLNMGMRQLTRIGVLQGTDGTVLTTKRGVRQFRSSGRKDIAYAMIYAWVAFASWLRLYDEIDMVRGNDASMCKGF